MLNPLANAPRRPPILHYTPVTSAAELQDVLNRLGLTIAASV